MFHRQLRAILRASHYGKIKILEFSTRRGDLREERSDRFPANRQISVAAIEDGIRLEEGSHPIDVSHPLPGNQQALQILGITRGLAVWPIAHGDTSSDGIQSS